MGADRPPVNAQGIKRNMVVLGTSIGGVEALRQLCAHLPATFPGTIGVVLHRSPMFELDLGALFGRRERIPVREPTHEDTLETGVMYVAPRDRHMLFYPDRIELSHGPKEHYTRPAIDPLFVSAATAFGPRVVGLLLTGGGTDGVRGLISIKASHGLSVIQKPTEARSPSMPTEALRQDHVDLVVSLDAIPELLLALAGGHAVHQDRPS